MQLQYIVNENYLLNETKTSYQKKYAIVTSVSVVGGEIHNQFPLFLANGDYFFPPFIVVRRPTDSYF